jgi:hypothetical protein
LKLGQQLQPVPAIEGDQYMVAFVRKDRVEKLRDSELVIDHEHRRHD